jgi:two-component system, sensor histidine kinase LadS
MIYNQLIYNHLYHKIDLLSITRFFREYAQHLLFVMSILVLVSSSSLLAQKVLHLRETSQESIDLKEVGLIFEDKSGKLSIADIKSASQDIQFQSIQYFTAQSAYHPLWLKFKIKNQLNQSLERYIVFEDRLDVNFIELSVFEGQRLLHTQKGGMYCPLSELKNIEERFKFKISIEAGKEVEIYIKFKNITGYEPDTSCKLEAVSHTLIVEKNTDLFQFLLHGFLWMLILYNLLQYFVLHEKTYLWYVCYVFSLNIFISFHNFILVRYIIPEYPKFTIFINSFVESGSEIFYFLFIQSFFKTHRKHPFIHRLINIVLIVILIRDAFNYSVLLSGFHVFISDLILSLPLLPILLLMIYILIQIGTKAKTAGWLLLIGTFSLLGIVLISNVLALLVIFKYINWTLLFLTYFLEAGIIVENIFFSLALGFLIIQNQKETLNAQKEIISLQEESNEKLEEKVNERMNLLKSANEEIKKQNESIREINKDLMASIHYAKQIQEAILPPFQRLYKIFPNHFIFNKPRDIVSGDFYWVDEIPSSPIYVERRDAVGHKTMLKGYTNPKVIVAVGDCTGHGVPGALMSMIGNDLLNHIILQKDINEPNKILNELNLGIIAALRQQEGFNKDGMDIALCSIDMISSMITFAGANSSIAYIAENQLQVLKGDSQGIGGFQKKEFAGFTNQILDFNRPALKKSSTIMLYLFTDGYSDQFGGEKGKKFMQSRFKELLLKIHSMPIEAQKKLLGDNLQNWQGNLLQVDDILVMGIRLLF